MTISSLLLFLLSVTLTMMDVSLVLLLLFLASNADWSSIDRCRFLLEKGIKSYISRSLTDDVFSRHKTQTGPFYESMLSSRMSLRGRDLFNSAPLSSMSLLDVTNSTTLSFHKAFPSLFSKRILPTRIHSDPLAYVYLINYLIIMFQVHA